MLLFRTGCFFCIFLLAARASIPEVSGRTVPSAETEATTKVRFALWQLPNKTHSQMMSYVLQSPHGKLVVIDGGTAGDAPYLATFLEERGNAVDAWFITHPHGDHMDALREILKAPGNLRIGPIYGSMPSQAWLEENGGSSEKMSFRLFNEALAGAGRAVEELSLGQEIDIDGIHIEVLGIKNEEIRGNPINNSSIVLRVSDDAKSILFLGDLGVEGGEKLLNGPYADRLPADYVQMAHHGQNGVNEAFYRHVNAAYCLWPTPDWLWENDNGGGRNSGPWRTLEVRAWMDKLPVKGHCLTFEDVQKIE